ncbi:MAG: hypothetical protein ACOYNY_39835 [Caldilineaceae bacterium]
MPFQRKQFWTRAVRRRVMLGGLISGLALLLFFAAYWFTLLLINFHPGFIPNADKRTAMYRFATRRPQQGSLWIF